MIMREKRRGPGYLPLLSLRVLLRRPGASLLLAAVAALGVYAGCGLQSLVLHQERAIRDTVENTVIHCTVTDVRGMNADQLNLFSSYVEALLGRRAGDRVHIRVSDALQYDMVVRSIEKGEDDGSASIRAY